MLVNLGGIFGQFVVLFLGDCQSRMVWILETVILESEHLPVCGGLERTDFEPISPSQGCVFL